MNREEFLEEAKKIICKDRNKRYGSPEKSFDKIADFWSVYLNKHITPKDVAIMMCLFKISRIETGKNDYSDNYVDLIGYAACGGEIALQNN